MILKVLWLVQMKKEKIGKKYANQTKNIIEELEWYRDLSGTQKELVRKIKDKLKLVLEDI